MSAKVFLDTNILVYSYSSTEKYQYSFYDSLIISAALSCNCEMLFSEDLQHGQIIEERLKIINPFL
jgi:predicted nucleic acid-binding protein